jgi:hypothetical protein
MRKLFGAILTLTFASGAMALAADAPQPKIVVANPIHDFGPVEKTAKLTHDFEIRNDGNAELKIREARAECACTVTRFDATIAAGATGRVHVEFDPMDLLGPVSKTILVFTNDPAAPEVVLTVKAGVKPIFGVKPGYARYIYVQKEIPGVITQTIWSMDGSDFRILGVESPYPYLKTAFWEAKPEERLADHPGKQWRVSTTLEPDSPVGALVKMVEITTDNPKQRKIELPVSGFVRPVIAVTPQKGDFGTHKREDPFNAAFKVQNFATDPINVTEATTDIPGVKLKVEPVSAGRVYNVVIALADDIPAGPVSGVIKIKTDSPKAPLIEVPLVGRIE